MCFDRVNDVRICLKVSATNFKMLLQIFICFICAFKYEATTEERCHSNVLVLDFHVVDFDLHWLLILVVSLAVKPTIIHTDMYVNSIGPVNAINMVGKGLPIFLVANFPSF